mgnify:CR=1 FL=1
MTVGPTKLGRTAFGANLRGGALALSVGEAQMYGGIAKGSFGIARSDAVADVKAQFQFTDVDLQACASELFGISKLSGRGNLNVSLVASGASPFGLASSLDGNATLTGHDGAIARLQCRAIAEAAGAAAACPAAAICRSGSTPYDNLTVSVKLQRRHRHRRRRPRRWPDDAPDADRHRFGAGARIRPQGRRQPDASATGGDKGFDLPFVVQGPWDDPLVFPDPESLIRRSPGAAQLLDAVKDRKTRDAVRSVIERFTGGGPEAGGAGSGGWGEGELARLAAA